MQFTYHEDAKNSTLKIEGQSFVHLFKSRRANTEELLNFRNLKDNNLYRYKILEINKKDAFCELIETLQDEKKTQKPFTLAWSVIDPKTIEKTLPFLNEIGVEKIIFVYTRFSQHNFKIDIEKLKRVLINSCEQCGRADLMEFEVIKSLNEFMKKYDDFGVIDFSSNRMEEFTCKLPNTWLVGCEGGFSKEEKELLSQKITIGFETSNILRSESAAVAISSKIIL
ncbi:MAG: 16S rRNA (uracil(1498)-N(3))-methyltransferase [Campylobacteraceae bacterium]